ncbi:hypothetical protein [Candidatus Harpocratesius sp.]
MKRTKIGIYILIFLICFTIGLIREYPIDGDLGVILSYLFVGLWICLSGEFIGKFKKNRENLAGQNQFILIFGSLAIGTFYAIWGDYTLIFSNSIDSNNGDLNFNVWHLIFGLPYLLIGIFFLILCIKKYLFIYLGAKSINSKKFASFLEIFFIIVNIIYFFSPKTNNYSSIMLQPYRINILLLVQTVILFFLFIYNIASRGPSISSYSVSRVTSRLNDIDRQIADADRLASQARQRELEARRRRQQEQQKQEARRKQQEERKRKQQEQNRIRQQRKAREKIKSTNVKVGKPKSSKNNKHLLLQMKPKTGTLTEDDFKCIFCFELPFHSVKKQGIVLCPNCNYPAHVDEFKEWVKHSNLCSRCDGEIPASFRRNPKVISVRQYLQAYKYWKRKFK